MRPCRTHGQHTIAPTLAYSNNLSHRHINQKFRLKFCTSSGRMIRYTIHERRPTYLLLLRPGLERRIHAPKYVHHCLVVENVLGKVEEVSLVLDLENAPISILLGPSRGGPLVKSHVTWCKLLANLCAVGCRCNEAAAPRSVFLAACRHLVQTFKYDYHHVMSYANVNGC